MPLIRWFSLLLLAPAMLRAEVAIPDTPPGQVLAAWLEAYNSADRAKIRAFRDTYALDPGVEDVISWRHDSGEVAVIRIERDEPMSISALLQPSTSDTLERIEFVLDEASPPKIGSITYLDTPRPKELAIPRVEEPAALAAWLARGDAMSAQDRFAGAALVARDGEILAQSAWGMANRETGQPNTAESRFRLGSMNKMFTAVAVLQLVEQGTLELDAPLGRYLTDYANREVADKVTLRHLLGHTGGTGDIFGPEFERHRDALVEHDDYLSLFSKRAPEFEPGSQMRYSNYGFVLLGAVIEKVTGMSYHDYVQRHVFEPAGMTRTGSLPESESVEGRTVGYMRVAGRWVPNVDTLPARGMAAGGGYSTLTDLLRFARALQSEKLLPAAVLARATTSPSTDGWYGLGFMTSGAGAAKWYGHDGGAQGMSTVLHIYPEAGYVVIALANLDPPAANHLAGFFENRMPLPE
jgi:D-alanyl-D-alanine carboxypeptidase